MKQITQDYRHGKLYVDEVPVPLLKDKGAIVRTRCSVVSAGTERSMLEFASQGLVGKARSRPDLVKQVIRKVKSDGLIAAYRASMSRLDVPLPLGYSSAGEIVEVGASVPSFKVGDRVACAGGGYASHAELVYVPKNLMVKIPEGVSYEDAAFATVGAIALQGVRVADIRLGERVVVIGLGLLGLLTVQILKAAGCMVLGTDLNPDRVKLALDLSADSAIVTEPDVLAESVAAFTSGRGADAVIITAATKSNAPTELAGEISRLKGRVVAVGDVGMNIPRRTYYQKELEYRISMSYGPGRYDPNYEEKGIDYPYAYVPFTEQRNLETFLQLVKEGRVTPGRLVTHRFSIHEAEEAYEMIRSGEGGYLGVVFTYPEDSPIRRRVDLKVEEGRSTPENSVKLGMIGAGNYAKLMLLPYLSRMKEVEFVGVSTSTGISGKHAARKYGFRFCTTDNEEIFRDKDINAVVIATRHNLHADLTVRALASGKHVFVEKPLATGEAELSRLVEAVRNSDRILMMGFNRRFAPLAVEAKRFFAGRAGPLSMIYRVNAGAVPPDHWTQDPEEGGGRIVGEVCHFVDLLQFLCGARPETVYAAAAGREEGALPEDNLSVTIRFEDGSVGTIAYFSTGDRAIPKEYVEIYGEGKTFILEDFRRARFASGGNVRVLRGGGQDKGQKAELQAFVQAVLGKRPAPIPFEELVYTTLATFRIMDSLKERCEVPVGWTRDLEQENEIRRCF
ncbi:MAG TPA: Gfo/Idh/MocA family oxidoreductase [Syntrophomonadaceae bacterium]|nr:Gfo/Idh/MocA family oxidoreductase [Syntrophomonadaceae bacterium]